MQPCTRTFFALRYAQKKYKITKFARKKSSRKKVRAKKGPGVEAKSDKKCDNSVLNCAFFARGF